MILKKIWSDVSRKPMSVISIKDSYEDGELYHVTPTKISGGHSFSMTVGGKMAFYVVSGMIRVSDSNYHEDVSRGEYVIIDRGRYRMQTLGDEDASLIEASFVPTA